MSSRKWSLTPFIPRNYNGLHLFNFLLIIGIIGMMICSSACAQESMQFKSEAKKLDFVRKMLKNEKHMRVSEYSTSHCNQMMKDLLEGKNFKAIEPYLRTDSEDDPRLARWNQCKQKDYHDVGVDEDRFFGGLSELGDSPYRFYRIELDGNRKNGPEDMVYYEKPSDPLKSGDTGYTWVDLMKCERKDGFPVGSMSQFREKAVSLNALVYYKGKLWAIDYVEGLEFSLMRWINLTKMKTCQWWLYDPKKSKTSPDDK